MFCKKCGKELKEDAVFCPGCGNQVILSDGVQNTTVQQNANITAPVVDNGTQASISGIINTIINWYMAVLKKYTVFTGRARRKEYWIFVLINSIIGLGFFTLSKISGIGIVFTILSSIYQLAILCPSIAVVIRRLHDVGRPGVHILFMLIPIVGVILLIIWLATEGAAGDNQYGPNPKI